MAITDRHEQEPAGSPRQDVAAHEICVSGHDDAVVKVRHAASVRVWRAVVGKIQRVEGVVPGGAQAARDPCILNMYYAPATVERIADAVERLASDLTLAGRVLVWWSEDSTRLVRWGDHGYSDPEAFEIG